MKPVLERVTGRTSEAHPVQCEHQLQLLRYLNAMFCLLINYRPQTKVMFSHVSVCTQGGLPLQRRPWTETTPGQRSPRIETPSPGQSPPGTEDGNEQAVRILLECFLVHHVFLQETFTVISEYFSCLWHDLVENLNKLR